MRVNCREQIANPAEPVNGQDERRKCAAIPLLAFNHPPAGDHFCVAKVLLQKENTILPDGVSFCDCPQVLLSALPPTARKGECEGCAPQGAFRSATDAKRRHLARRWNL